MSIDEFDRRPASLWTHLAIAVGVATGAPLDDDDGASAAADPLELLAAAAERPGPGGVLVLDGVRSFDRDEILRHLGGLIERLARRLRIVVIGRAEPLLALAAWRARGLVTDLD
ncbi:hypothetical protein QUT57_22825, partial [Xanthomonas citri pv. citri]